jgi:hypothetical protein
VTHDIRCDEQVTVLKRSKPKTLTMFGLFKKKDPREEIMKRYKAMLAESHRLSTVDRKASDLKRAEAEALLDELDRTPAKG